MDLFGCSELFKIIDNNTCVIFSTPNRRYHTYIREAILRHFTFVPLPICTCTIGADPEFELLTPSGIIPAGAIRKTKCVGVDGSGFQVELRPEPSESPEEFLENIGNSILEFHDNNNGDLCLTGHRYSLGFHLHAAWEADCTSEDGHVIALQADRFLGRLFVDASGKARGDYKRLGAYRTNSADYGGRGGMEYRTMPSIIALSEKHLLIILKIWKLLVDKILSGEEFPDTNNVATKEEYAKLGISENEYSELIAYSKLLKKIAETGEHIALKWTNMNYKIRVEFSSNDTFRQEVRQFLNQNLRKIEVNKKITIKFFGLKNIRGLVSNIQVGDWGIVDKEFPPIMNKSTLYIGLPFSFRTETETFEKYKNAVIDSIIKLIEEVNQDVSDSSM